MDRIIWIRTHPMITSLYMEKNWRFKQSREKNLAKIPRPNRGILLCLWALTNFPVELCFDVNIFSSKAMYTNKFSGLFVHYLVYIYNIYFYFTHFSAQMYIVLVKTCTGDEKRAIYIFVCKLKLNNYAKKSEKGKELGKEIQRPV